MSNALPPPSRWHSGEDTTGFPSPAQLWRERVLSLDDLLLYPEATFFVRMRGHSMRGVSIFDQDLLVIDRAVPATNGSIIVAQFKTRLLVKRLLIQERRIILYAAHPSYPPIEIQNQQDLTVWGVVVYVLRATHPWSRRRLWKDSPSERHDALDRDP